MDAVFRLVLVQAWLWANRSNPDISHLDLDEAAASLSDLSFSHGLWEDFEATWADEVQTEWPDFNHSDWARRVGHAPSQSTTKSSCTSRRVLRSW